MKFVRTHRGLSSVVTASILLTSVAVLGSSMVAWSNGNLKTFETSLVNTSANMTNKINENLNIENVVFCTCSSLSNPKTIINVTLTNIGTVPVKITSIQVNSTTINNYLSMSTALPVTIKPQASYIVSAKFSGNTVWNSKSVDTITVTTQRGTILTTQAAPP